MWMLVWVLVMIVVTVTVVIVLVVIVVQSTLIDNFISISTTRFELYEWW